MAKVGTTYESMEVGNGGDAPLTPRATSYPKSSNTKQYKIVIGLMGIVLIVLIGLVAAAYVRLGKNDETSPSITTAAPVVTTNVPTQTATYAGSLTDSDKTWDSTYTDDTNTDTIALQKSYAANITKLANDAVPGCTNCATVPSSGITFTEATSKLIRAAGSHVEVHFEATVDSASPPSGSQMADRMQTAAKNSNPSYGGMTVQEITTTAGPTTTPMHSNPATTESTSPKPVTTATSKPVITTSTTMGSTTMGSTTMGSTTIGSTTMPTTTAPPTTTFHIPPAWTDAANFLLMAMNKTADPCNNFYEYACGGWAASNPMPASHSHYYTYVQVQDQVLNSTIEALKAVDCNNTETSEALKKAKMLFDSCVTSKDDENAGVLSLLEDMKGLGYFGWPILHPNVNFTEPELKFTIYEVGAWSGLFSYHHGLNVFFTPYVDVDWKNVSSYRFYVDQGTLNMPQAVYLNETRYNSSIMEYKSMMTKFVTQMAKQVHNMTTLDEQWQEWIEMGVDEIYCMEKDMAEIIVPEKDRRNYEEMYSKMTANEAQEKWPYMNWTLFMAHTLPFAAPGHNLSLVDMEREIVINECDVMDKVGEMLEKYTVAQQQNYMLWRLAYSVQDFWDQESSNAFREYSRKVHFKDLPSTEQSCVNTVIDMMPYAAGRLYIDQVNFAQAAKDEVGRMLNNIHQTFGVMLGELSWLDYISTMNAEKKLLNFVRNPGYPDWIKNDTLLDMFHERLDMVNLTTYFDTYEATIQWSSGVQFYDLLKTTVDRHDFLGSPATVNAWYEPELNSITFPAGILQRPYFDVEYPKAINYGAIGTVMGHETTHGFDDEGVQFTYNGALDYWMRPLGTTGFDNMADCVVDEYSDFYYPDLKLHLNGFNNQGENIADNGGIREAYYAYQNYVKMNGAEPRLPGMSDYSMEQVFFLGYASFWCGSATDAYIENEILTNPHSPAKDRVHGTLRNFEEFGDAFQCKKGVDALFPADDDRCYVWTSPPNVTSEEPGFKEAGDIFKAAMNTSVNPCEDFYQFTCGNWKASHESGASVFGGLANQVEADVVSEVQAIDVNDMALPEAIRKTRMAYDICIKHANMSEMDAFTELNSVFNMYGGFPAINSSWTNSTSYGELVGKLDRNFGIGVVLYSSVSVDYEDVSKYALFVDTGDLVYRSSVYMNDTQLDMYKEIIFNTTQKFAEVLGINTTTLTLREDANEIANFERDLAIAIYNITIANETMRSVYNPYTIENLGDAFPAFEWNDYFMAIVDDQYASNINDNFTSIIYEPLLQDRTNQVLESTPCRTKHNYAMWRLLLDSAQLYGPYLNEMYKKLVVVQKFKHLGPFGMEMLKEKSDPTTCVEKVGGAGFGFSESRLFVDAQFPAVARDDVNEMLTLVLSSLNETMKELFWLDYLSTPAAIKKLDNVVKNPGYPDWIKNDTLLDAYYSELKITSSLIWPDVVQRGNAFNTDKNIDLLFNVPVNRHAFNGYPSTVNAWYAPDYNSITFPAGILQVPFYKHTFPKFVNYGGIGMVMGHELTHGFDNSGIRYDWNGTLNTWMTYSSLQGFDHMAQCVVDEYDQFCVEIFGIKVCVRGEQTEGENIADNGGIREAYKAYMKWIDMNGPEKRLPGLEKLTPEQGFFVSFGNVWCNNANTFEVVMQIFQDVHSPGEYRVLGTAQNFEKFGEAFQCYPGDPMYPKPDDHCYVWANPPNMVSNDTNYQEAAEVLMTNMDKTVDPCDDFYQFTCGNFKKNPAVPVNTTYFSTFSLVDKRVTNDIIDEFDRMVMVNESMLPEAMMKATEVYKSCIAGASYPINDNSPLVDVIQGLSGGWPIITPSWTNSSFNFSSLLGRLGGEFGIGAFISAFADVNFENAQAYVLMLDQGTLGLGTRDYFLNESVFGNITKQYRETIKMAAMILSNDTSSGVAESTIDSDVMDIYNFEVELAQITVAEDNRRNYTLQSNNMRTGSAMQYFKMLNFMQYYQYLLPSDIADKISPGYQINLNEPEFLMHLNDLLTKTDPKIYVNYLVWRYVQSQMQLLDPRMQSAYQEFLKVYKAGEELPLDKETCVAIVENNLPYVTGRIFVDKSFSADAKEEVSKLINNIISSFTTMLGQLTWMDQTSKDAAIKKANNVQANPAYPDFILNDTALAENVEGFDSPMEGETFFDVNGRLTKYATQKQLSNLREGVLPDRTDFHGSPAVVNAWYYPEFNSITFPAGILQAPFFKSTFPKAINYGAIGSVMGHELTHGFDDEGVQFDYEGTLKTWMTEGSYMNFTEMAACVIEEYSEYCYPEINACVSGVRTQGEDIADNGGIKEAYNAYMKYQMENGWEKRLPGLEKLSTDQIFFLSFANFWCGQIEDDRLIQQLHYDPHAPWKVRVYETLRNFGKFGDAYNCKPGSTYNPPASETCNVW